jgi:hypothetical protein
VAFLLFYDPLSMVVPGPSRGLGGSGVAQKKESNGSSSSFGVKLRELLFRAVKGLVVVVSVRVTRHQRRACCLGFRSEISMPGWGQSFHNSILAQKRFGAVTSKYYATIAIIITWPVKCAQQPVVT